jgi:hypothetical protein
MVVSVKKKDRFPPQKKLPPPIKFSYKGGWWIIFILNY